MKTTGTAFAVDDCDDRIREILDAADQSFEERDSIPPAEQLTYSNGFYVYCTALFIDIRGSSKLPENHTRPVLAKIYRTYLSECVAILNQDANCREVFINGDCVTGIFDTTTKPAIDSAFFRAAQLNTMLKLLNWRLDQKGYTPIQCGIGIDYGRALMLKAGFRGSGINEIVWMGDVVNNASNLCHQGNKGSRKAIQVSPVVHQNIRDDYKALLDPAYETIFEMANPPCFEGDLVAVTMNSEIEAKQEANRVGLARALMGFQNPNEWALAMNAMARPRGLFDDL